MQDYVTHWEFSYDLAILVVVENVTSNFAKYKRLYFTMEQYKQFYKK
jgi:hypothetical protein